MPIAIILTRIVVYIVFLSCVFELLSLSYVPSIAVFGGQVKEKSTFFEHIY